MHDLLDGREYKYKVGEVVIDVNHSHENKIRILKMQMDNWSSSNGNVPLDSPIGRQYDTDVKRTDHLFGMLKTGAAKNLTRDEMMEMNILFKRYGGIRKKK